MTFTERTLWCLKQAGWHENYRADVAHYLRESKEEGCEIPLPVANFLQHFGNLQCVVPFIYRADITLIEVLESKHYDRFHLNPYKTAQGEYCGAWRYIAEAFQVATIYPVGEYQNRELLFMTPDAHLYGLIDSKIHERRFDYGTGAEVLNALCDPQ